MTEPDAKPAGAVVAAVSGLTAGETAPIQEHDVTATQILAAQRSIRDIAASMPLTPLSLNMLLSVCDGFADRLHREGGVKGADEVVGCISDALIANECITAITPEDRTEWAAEDAADRRGDERRLERVGVVA